MKVVLEAELTSPVSRKGSALSKTFRYGERPSIGLSSIDAESSIRSGIPSRQITQLLNYPSASSALRNYSTLQ